MVLNYVQLFSMFFITALEGDDDKRKRSSLLRKISEFIMPFDTDIGKWAAVPVLSNGLYE